MTGYRRLLANGEVRTLLATSAISTAGDQLARVALSVLVFRQTDSALLSGIVYALTFLPALVGGPLVAGLSDRHPRRRVMVATDLLRFVLVCALALPGLPLITAFGLVIFITVAESAFDASRAALLPLLARDDYQRALALDRGVQQAAQVVGFAGAGVALAFVSPSVVLLLDGATFLASAVFLYRGLRHRAAAAPRTHVPQPRRGRVAGGFAGAWADARVGLATVFGNPAVRRPVVLVWLASAVAVAPEGIAVPYAEALHGGGIAIGLLLAANPMGNALAGPLTALAPKHLRRSLLLPLTGLVCLPLVACAADPALVGVLALLALSGSAMTMSILARAEFVAVVDDAHRGRAFGLAASGITVVQGLSVGLSAALCEVLPPNAVVALVGSAGLVGVTLVALGSVLGRRKVVQVEPVINVSRPESIVLGIPATASERA
jgi:MFS family permease